MQSASLFPGFNLDCHGMSLWPQAAADARKTGFQQVLQFDSGLALVQAANKVRQDALALNALLHGRLGHDRDAVSRHDARPAAAAGGEDHQAAHRRPA